MKIKEYNKLTKEEKKKIKFKDWPIISKIGCSITLGILIISIFILIFTGKNSTSSSKNDIDSTELSFKASYLAEEVIKQNLKSPSTAEFSDVKEWFFSDSTVVVKGNVDSQNGFGAMLRSSFYVKLKWKNDFTKDENWEALKANVE